MGSHVICEHKGLIYEEAPQAYKPVETIVSTLVESGMVAIVASFRPVTTYKTRRLAKAHG